jgi:hypothetical protein
MRHTAICQRSRRTSSALERHAIVTKAAPIKRNMLDESNVLTRESCHSGCRSLIGNKLKIIELRVDPMIIQPRTAIVKFDLDESRFCRSASESAYIVISSECIAKMN